ncbi:MAG: NAD(P)-dependent oxidoreductase [Caldilineaceae bacterium]
MPAIPFTHAWIEVKMPFLQALLPSNVEQILPDSQSPVYANALPAQAIFASSILRYDGALMDALPNLRLIARTGIGVDNVDLDAATARGIVVTNTPDGPTESTAEHTVAMLLACAKRLKQGNDNLIAGKWGPRSGPILGTEVQGKTLGLLGLGRIGRRVAHICGIGLLMKVIAYDPYVSQEQADALGVTMTDMESVIRQSDFLSLHMPATPETYRLINRERIATMKDGAYLLNMARGPLVDEAALLEAIDSGKLSAAGIDVYDPEPVPLDSRLRNHPMILATPHIASTTVEGLERMQRMAVERAVAFFNGERPQDVVNGEVWEKRR